MNIDKYLKTISDLNILIEGVTDQDIKDVQSSIDLTKQRMDALNAKILSRLNAQNQQYLPYDTVKIEFFNELKLSVRTSTEKEEINLLGRDTFDVVGYSEGDYLIIQKPEWGYTVALKLYNPKMVDRLEQTKELQLFYNEHGDISSGKMTRSGKKQETNFRFISIE